MKLVSFIESGLETAGILTTKGIISLRTAAKNFPVKAGSTMNELLSDWDKAVTLLRKIEEKASEENSGFPFIQTDLVTLLSPVPHPPSCRDGYAFRQHVATARRNRGVEMIPEFDQYPVFYFTNHQAVFGGGEIILETDHFKNLDFELECAIVISKEGKNINASEADVYIAGYMVMNELSARVLQMEEMKLNLGPAKGKDFATSFGPFLTTPDEIYDYKISTPYGDKYDLPMTAYHNGELISRGNLKDMNWTFAEIIERASYGVMLHPGDIIGSGTVGTGCYLELNGTRALEAKQKGESYTPVWLLEGDAIELEIQNLGRLKNTFRKNGIDYSILSKKKKS